MMDEQPTNDYRAGYQQGVIDVLALINSQVIWPTNDVRQLNDIKHKLAELMEMYAPHLKPPA